MNLSLNEEQLLIKNSAEKFFLDNLSFEQRNKILTSDSKLCEDLIAKSKELGWYGLPFDQKFGGLGANITGGGLEDNIKRILPKNLSAKIDLNKIKPNSIFKWIYYQGVSDKEMIKTFNCGVGFCIIIKSKNFNKIKKYFTKSFQPYAIGKIFYGKKSIDLHGKIKW